MTTTRACSAFREESTENSVVASFTNSSRRRSDFVVNGNGVGGRCDGGADGGSLLWIGGTSALARTYLNTFPEIAHDDDHNDDHQEHNSPPRLIVTGLEPIAPSWLPSSVMYISLDLRNAEQTKRTLDSAHTAIPWACLSTIIISIRGPLLSCDDGTNVHEGLLIGLEVLLQEIKSRKQQQQQKQQSQHYKDTSDSSCHTARVTSIHSILHISSVAAVNHLQSQVMVHEQTPMPLWNTYTAPYDRFKRRCEEMISQYFPSENQNDNNNNQDNKDQTMMILSTQEQEQQQEQQQKPQPQPPSPYDDVTMIGDGTTGSTAAPALGINVVHLRISAIFSDPPSNCILCQALQFQSSIPFLTKNSLPIRIDGNSARNVCLAMHCILQRMATMAIMKQQQQQQQQPSGSLHSVYYYTRPLKEPVYTYGDYLQFYKQAYSDKSNPTSSQQKQQTSSLQPQPQQQQDFWSNIYIPYWMISSFATVLHDILSYTKSQSQSNVTYSYPTQQQPQQEQRAFFHYMLSYDSKGTRGIVSVVVVVSILLLLLLQLFVWGLFTAAWMIVVGVLLLLFLQSQSILFHKIMAWMYSLDYLLQVASREHHFDNTKFQMEFAPFFMMKEQQEETIFECFVRRRQQQQQQDAKRQEKLE